MKLRKKNGGFTQHLFSKKNSEGFTLIEILVVIGIIAILAVIVLIAINPARQFAQARNTQRTSNVNAILNGIGQYLADNKGVDVDNVLPDFGDNTDAINLCEALVPTYLPALPVDPTNNDPAYVGAEDTDCTETAEVGYDVAVAEEADGGRITVSAVGELGADISVTR